jgi:3-keto-5-aminohexanoate cleavage enzyme
MEIDPKRRSVTIAVAPNGARRTKADHPALPVTPNELANTAAECLEAGAAMIHVHVRSRDGGHSLDADAYKSAMGAIRTAIGDRLVVQITTEALGLYSPQEQIAVVKAVRPEAVSLAFREIVPHRAAEGPFLEFLRWLLQEEIFPQIILYTPEEASLLAEVAGRSDIPAEEIPVLYVLGRHFVNQTSRPADLAPFLKKGIARFQNWMVCAFGKNETACVIAAAQLGGDIRVGFENNIWMPDGTLASSNAASVAATAGVLGCAGHICATAADVRHNWLTFMRAMQPQR